MKPIPAIVEKHVDVDTIAEQIIVAAADLLRIEHSITRLRGQLDDAVSTAKMRRIEIGRLLDKARPTWPTRGPNAKGWGEFLKRVKLDDSTAYRYIQEFKDPDGFAHGQRATPSESGDSPSGVSENSDEGDVGRPVNGNGGSGDPARGTWCTPAKYAAAVGSWDVDPFSNPRSHIVARFSCQLERMETGLADPAQPGSFMCNETAGYTRATETTRVWIQPPYELVLEAIEHYGHTRFCALLRFDPSTEWFAALWRRTTVLAIPLGERLEFEPPPGIEASANPYPHAFYYADERDVTDEIRRLCIVLRVEHTT